MQSRELSAARGLTGLLRTLIDLGSSPLDTFEDASCRTEPTEGYGSGDAVAPARYPSLHQDARLRPGPEQPATAAAAEKWTAARAALEAEIESERAKLELDRRTRTPRTQPGREKKLAFGGSAKQRVFVFKKWADQGSNQGPSDLQSDALPTELTTRVTCICEQLITGSEQPTRLCTISNVSG